MDHNGLTPDGDRFGQATIPEADGAQPRVNMSKLISGILDDATSLFKQQLVMLKAEVKEDVKKTASAAKFMALGAGLAVLGGLFLLLGLVPLLHWLAPSLPEFACWFIVGGLMFVVGGLLAYAGYKKMTSFNPLPDKTLHALQENMTCLTHPQK